MNEKANILIVDDDSQTVRDLQNYLETKEKIGMAEWMPSVAQACDYISTKPVDLVVMDLILPTNDGYYFLELLNKMNLKKLPDVVITSAISHDRAIKKAMDLGVKYYMLKPYDNEILYDRMMFLLEDDPIAEEEPFASDVSLDQKIMEIFLALGLPPHLKGYRYLREAVKMVIADPTIIYSITKRLYPEIAKTFGVTPTKVELAIRHTLEVTWQRNKMDNLESIFGCDVYLKNMKPTNGEFIALVADRLATAM